jgi:hypothetical protein
MEIPVPTDLSTIEDRMIFSFGFFKLFLDLLHVNPRDLGLKQFNFKKKSIRYHPGLSFTPGQSSLSVFSGSGPNGPLLLGRVKDLITVANSKYYRQLLEFFTKQWLSLGIHPKVPHLYENPVEDLINWLGKDKIQEVATSSVPSGKKPFEGGNLRRLTYFSDGAGK